MLAWPIFAVAVFAGVWAIFNPALWVASAAAAVAGLVCLAWKREDASER